jgi:hypothetical protein
MSSPIVTDMPSLASSVAVAFPIPGTTDPNYEPRDRITAEKSQAGDWASCNFDHT